MIVNTRKRGDWSRGFRNSADVACGCQYVRWMANGQKEDGPALLVIAIGINSIAAGRDARLSPEEAAQLLEREAETIRGLLKELADAKENTGATMRPD